MHCLTALSGTDTKSRRLLDAAAHLRPRARLEHPAVLIDRQPQPSAYKLLQLFHSCNSVRYQPPVVIPRHRVVDSRNRAHAGRNRGHCCWPRPSPSPLAERCPPLAPRRGGPPSSPALCCPPSLSSPGHLLRGAQARPRASAAGVPSPQERAYAPRSHAASSKDAPATSSHTHNLEVSYSAPARRAPPLSHARREAPHRGRAISNHVKSELAREVSAR